MPRAIDAPPWMLQIAREALHPGGEAAYKEIADGYATNDAPMTALPADATARVTGSSAKRSDVRRTVAVLEQP